jgi:S1-C subfamily serine protease
MSLLSRRNLVRQVRPAVFMVEKMPTPGSRVVLGANIVGTAFAISKDGFLVTAGHVVQGTLPQNLRIMSPYGRSGEYGMGLGRTVSEIIPHPTLDIALLRVSRFTVKDRVTVGFAATSEIMVGDEVVLLGFAGGNELAFCDEILGGA